MKAPLQDVQAKLKELELDGWLLYVWRDVNPVAVAVLSLPEGQVRTRRCFYWIPAEGAPLKLLHRIEPFTLAHLPGEERRYLSYISLREALEEILRDARRIAMEYSPQGAIPTVSWVDAGMVELVRGCGVEVVSSADLIQYFEATLTDAQISTHFIAAERCRTIAAEAFEEVGRKLRAGKRVRETDVQAFIMRRFDELDLTTDHPPIVAADANASNPHYNPKPGEDSLIVPGQVLLIDLWAKLHEEVAVYADQTWMGVIGAGPVPPRVQEVWELVRDARRAGWKLVQDRYAHGEPVHGWEVDEACRLRIEEAGYGEYFTHRTGHSITTEGHGSGANMDNLETRELRCLIPRTLFSIEPGVYLPEFGIRSEFNVLIDPLGAVVVAEGTDQEDLIRVEV